MTAPVTGPMTAPVTGPMLEVADLCVRAGARELVRGVSFQLGETERLGIIGASGSGKSITCMAIAGLLGEGLSATGSVRLDGGPNLLQENESALARIRGQRIGMVFQEPMTALNPTMRVGAQVAEAMTVHGVDRAKARRTTLELLSAVDLPEPERLIKAYPHQLSGGQRQRVVLAIALANSPDVLICDEPTTALDVTVQAKVLDLIDARADAATSAVLFISHDLAVVAQVCDRILVMYGGEVVEQGPVIEVLDDPQHAHTRQLLADADLGDWGRR